MPRQRISQYLGVLGFIGTRTMVPIKIANPGEFAMSQYARVTSNSITTTFSAEQFAARAGDYESAVRDGHWLVFGCLEGDDADSVCTVYASSEAAAVIGFTDWLYETQGASPDENSPNYAAIEINYVVFTGETHPDITTCNTGAF